MNLQTVKGFELFNMDIPASVFHMDYDKALSVCLDLYAGCSFRQAIDAYDKRVM